MGSLEANICDLTPRPATHTDHPGIQNLSAPSKYFHSPTSANSVHMTKRVKKRLARLNAT